ncbi:MAG: response regulator transcription factor [Clostridia bacterium]|nr:response regulator transcription factor [Clostridia bacterium]
MKLLIVDDEPAIRLLVKKYADFEGYESDEAADGMEAVIRCRQTPYDIVIMDIMMPELDGFSAVKEIRKNSDVPVIMLSARGEEYDKIHGFELGIDDYVTKPFSGKELMMRIAAVLARSNRAVAVQQERNVYENGDLKVDFTAHSVSIGGKPVDLTPKEFELLSYFISNKGIALTRESILSAVWGYDFYGDDRTLDTHIKLLRKSLGDFRDCIVTLRGVGYRFED